MDTNRSVGLALFQRSEFVVLCHLSRGVVTNQTNFFPTNLAQTNRAVFGRPSPSSSVGTLLFSLSHLGALPSSFVPPGWRWALSAFTPSYLSHSSCKRPHRQRLMGSRCELGLNFPTSSHVHPTKRRNYHLHYQHTISIIVFVALPTVTTWPMCGDD